MAPMRLDTPAAAAAWLAARQVRALGVDSRRLGAGDAFVAWPGHAADGRAFVAAALAGGAAACLVEADGVEAHAAAWGDDPRIAAVAGLKAATGPIAAAWSGAPSERLRLVAVTGTNGKTSTTWWLAQAFTALGQRCGVVGTLGIGEPPMADTPVESPLGGIVPTGMTTPDPVTLQAALRRFADAGHAACAIEATSIGLAEHRLDGCRVDTAVYTNFSRDHLDYHGSMDAYWDAKAALFVWPGLRAAVVNLDDGHGAALAERLAGSALEVWTTSARRPARLRATGVHHAGGGLGFEVHEGGVRAAVATPLLGDYNVANLLGVIGALRTAGVSLDAAARVCGSIGPVPGRMQGVVAPEAASLLATTAPAAAGLPRVVVDYAHTPDALEKALQALQPLALARGGALWCVFGCGGDRDASKRPLMGALAQRLAQQVVITTDNPRGETAAFIVLQIVAGLDGGQQRVKVIEDRRAAIAHAVRNAAAADVILIAGKGHEDYQEVRGVKRPFSDVDEARAALARRAGATA